MGGTDRCREGGKEVGGREERRLDVRRDRGRKAGRFGGRE